MNKKITSIILTIFLIVSMYNYVFAKYKEEQQIQIAEVNIEKTPIKKKEYTFRVYYMNQENNKAIKIKVLYIYEGDKYEAEILDFDGYTYLYSNQDLSGIMEKNVNIFLYYRKN